jgi:hypothetical protein
MQNNVLPAYVMPYGTAAQKLQVVWIGLRFAAR